MSEDGSKPEPPKTTKPLRALILPGGGGRGAYQVGVAKALLEKGLQFDLAFGTSIGALNATLLAQGGVTRLEEIWKNLRPKDIFRLPSAHQLGRIVLGSKLGLLDTTPLEELLRRELDLQKLKSATTKVGLFTTDLCSLETRFISINEVFSTNELIDVLMATSAVPLAFPPRQLHGKGLWVDGGLVKNTPLQAAINIGCQEIFMVLLHPETIDACPTTLWQVLSRCLDIVLDASARRELEAAQMHTRLIAQAGTEGASSDKINIHVFQPRIPLNITLLEIDPETSRHLIQCGYEDALSQLVTYFQESLPDADVARSSLSTAPDAGFD